MDADAGAFGVPFGRGAGALRVHRLDQALEPAPACADAEEIVQPLTSFPGEQAHDAEEIVQPLTSFPGEQAPSPRLRE